MIWLLHIASMRWDLVERALCPNRPSLYRLIIRRYEVHGILGQAPSSRRVLSREARPPGSGEVSLSQGLRTAGLLWSHALVGYRWSHTGLCPGSKPVTTGTSAASCHNPPRTVAR